MAEQDSKKKELAYGAEKQQQRHHLYSFTKETKFGSCSSSQPNTVRQRKAVPPGYLHDLFHTRHLMKSVGLRRGKLGENSCKGNGKVGKKTSLPAVALDNARLQPLPRIGAKVSTGGKITDDVLPKLFEQRKRFLQKKRRAAEKENTHFSDLSAQGQATGLLSLPEDVLLRIVCKLGHDDIKPLFLVCKQLSKTLQNAIAFHFNYATPSRMNANCISPGMNLQARRMDRRRNITAIADVLAHLRRGPRIVSGLRQRPTGSTGPRILSFTPAATPTDRKGKSSSQQGTPISRFIGTPTAHPCPSPELSPARGLRFASVGLSPTSMQMDDTCSEVVENGEVELVRD